jgi:hypothetical protein
MMQDTEIGSWSSNSARAIIKIGVPIIDGFIAWTKIHVTYHTSKMLAESYFCNHSSQILNGMIRALRIYMKNEAICFKTQETKSLMCLTEGFWESLRRLSSYTWMAKELLQVTDYFLPSNPVSTVEI